MCGRFALTATPEEVAAMYAMLEIADFPPRYNIAPTQPILMISAGERPAPGANHSGRREHLVRWGLIPGWAKDPRELSLMFNARAESAAEKAAFKGALRHRRTLVPASGFYEWKRSGTAKPQPWWVRPKHGGVIAFAGLMEPWLGADGSEIDTGAILTTHANADIAHIHERMPLVILPEDFSRWLDCRTYEPHEVADLMRPVGPDFFEAIPISDLVNKVDNTGPQVQERIPGAPPEPDQPRAVAQLSLF